MNITCYGGTETTTGSMHLLDISGSQILLDCGMYQGSRQKAYEINKHFPFDPASLETVILSHAHIDHCGNLPNLHKQGYEEKIFCTHATRDLVSVMLKDSAYIQMKDAEYLEKRGREVIGPLYTIEEAERTIWHFAAVNYHQKFRIHPDVKVEFFDAGHILGAALTKMTINYHGQEKTLTYAVDLGRKNLPILRDPENVGQTDVLVIESTYGGKTHTDITDAEELLAEVINRTVKRKGKIIIPAFSMERTQELAYCLRELDKKKLIPSIPIYVDSPLSFNITEIFRLHPECFDEETNRVIEDEEDPFGSARCTYIRSVNASKRLNNVEGSHIVISASGMCEAGRILHHLKNAVEDPANTILFVGYQAQGTLGRRIVEGADEIKVFGKMYKLNAEVLQLDTFSAHADENDVVDYIRNLEKEPEQILLVHGEEHKRAAMQKAIKEHLNYNAIMPKAGVPIELF